MAELETKLTDYFTSLGLFCSPGSVPLASPSSPQPVVTVGVPRNGQAGSLPLPTHGPGLVIKIFRPKAMGIFISFDQSTVSEGSVHVFLEHTRTQALFKGRQPQNGDNQPKK